MTGLGSLDSRLRPYAKALLQLAPQGSFVTSARRSRKSQAKLYRDYVAGRSRFPAAPPGRSKHERGLAFDIGGLSSSQQRQLGKIWERWGGRWGGRFKDPIHFESNP